MNRDRLRKQLEVDEARRAKPYRCPAGKLTIGVGRNLDDNGLRSDEIDYLLANDIESCVQELRRNLPWFDGLDDVRQEVLVNMCFNMGWTTLATFKTTLGHIEAGRYLDASKAMAASRWYDQVGARAKRLCAAMSSGAFG